MGLLASTVLAMPQNKGDIMTLQADVKIQWVLWWCGKCMQPRNHIAYKLPVCTYLTCPLCGATTMEPNGMRQDETFEDFFKRKTEGE